MLEALDRANLFLVPLDDRRRWYRYHHLFADVLRARLPDEQPDRVPELHRRASDWYEQNGERADAIDHALAGGDFERAADLVELAIAGACAGTVRRPRRVAGSSALPEELFRDRPVLSIDYVGVLLSTGELDGVEPRLRDAERWLDAAGDGRDRRTRRPGWSSWTRRRSAGCPAGWPSTARRRPCSAAIRPPR